MYTLLKQGPKWGIYGVRFKNYALGCKLKAPIYFQNAEFIALLFSGLLMVTLVTYGDGRVTSSVS